MNDDIGRLERNIEALKRTRSSVAESWRTAHRDQHVSSSRRSETNQAKCVKTEEQCNDAEGASLEESHPQAAHTRQASTKQQIKDLEVALKEKEQELQEEQAMSNRTVQKLREEQSTACTMLLDTIHSDYGEQTKTIREDHRRQLQKERDRSIGLKKKLLQTTRALHLQRRRDAANDNSKCVTSTRAQDLQADPAIPEEQAREQPKSPPAVQECTYSVADISLDLVHNTYKKKMEVVNTKHEHILLKEREKHQSELNATQETVDNLKKDLKEAMTRADSYRRLLCNLGQGVGQFLFQKPPEEKTKDSNAIISSKEGDLTNGTRCVVHADSTPEEDPPEAPAQNGLAFGCAVNASVTNNSNSNRTSSQGTSRNREGVPSPRIQRDNEGLVNGSGRSTEVLTNPPHGYYRGHPPESSYSPHSGWPYYHGGYYQHHRHYWPCMPHPRCPPSPPHRIDNGRERRYHSPERDGRFQNGGEEYRAGRHNTLTKPPTHLQNTVRFIPSPSTPASTNASSNANDADRNDASAVTDSNINWRSSHACERPSYGNSSDNLSTVEGTVGGSTKATCHVAKKSEPATDKHGGTKADCQRVNVSALPHKNQRHLGKNRTQGEAEGKDQSPVVTGAESNAGLGEAQKTPHETAAVAAPSAPQTGSLSNTSMSCAKCGHPFSEESWRAYHFGQKNLPKCPPGTNHRQAADVCIVPVKLRVTHPFRVSLRRTTGLPPARCPILW